NPGGAAPVEEHPGLQDLPAPRPAPVFELILAQNSLRALMLLRSHDKSPAIAVLRRLDGRLDSLADERQAPVHGLLPGAGGNRGGCRLHARAVVIFVRAGLFETGKR